MSCNCQKPDRTTAWTPIPDFRQPTEILPGENIDCYAKRAGTTSKDVTTPKLDGKIDNTSVTSDLNGVVNETFKLTDVSTRIATSWDITIDGQPVSATNIPNLTVNGNILSGTVTTEFLNKSYKVLVKANDSNGEIDSREFTFTPKSGDKDDTIKFVFPLPGGVITCKFGPRRPPAPGASSMHKGIDCALPGHAIGDIVSAADGTVVKCGPATGFGNWVVIEHRDSKNRLVATTVYGHMNEWYVKTGQKVSAGQKIAKEGNAGIGSGAHLHFEIHKGAWGNPVDPIPYLNGTIITGDGNDSSSIPSATIKSTSSNKGITTKEAESVNNDCPEELQNQAPPTTQSNPEPSSAPPPETNNNAPTKSDCKPDTQIPIDKVMSEMQRAFNEEPSLTSEDIKFLIQVARIESQFDPFAKNPTSSATGLYQMLDKIAIKYYGVIGIPPTCKNRCDPYYATKAQIAFFTQEFRPIWARYNSSGKTKIAGMTIKETSWSAKYPSLTQGEFMYGLIHHDGIGNAANGIDRQGVDYWRKKIRSA